MREETGKRSGIIKFTGMKPGVAPKARVGTRMQQNTTPHYVAAIPIASANAARTSGGWP